MSYIFITYSMEEDQAEPRGDRNFRGAWTTSQEVTKDVQFPPKMDLVHIFSNAVMFPWEPP